MQLKSLQYTLASFTIIAILGVQSFIVFYPKGRGGWMWPFIDYPMYCGARQEGDRLNVYYPVFAIFADQTEKQILPKNLGLNVFKFQSVFVPAVLCAAQGTTVGSKARPDANRVCTAGEMSRVKDLLKNYEQHTGQQIVRLRVEDYPLVLKNGRAERVRAETIQVLDLD